MSSDRQRFVLRTISILSDGVGIEYMDSASDMRATGLQHNHILFVPGGPEYDEEIEALLDAALTLLRDGLEDMRNTQPLDVPAAVDAAIQDFEDDD